MLLALMLRGSRRAVGRGAVAEDEDGKPVVWVLVLITTASSKRDRKTFPLPAKIPTRSARNAQTTQERAVAWNFLYQEYEARWTEI